jgi:hypothetical protein
MVAIQYNSIGLLNTDIAVTIQKPTQVTSCRNLLWTSALAGVKGQIYASAAFVHEEKLLIPTTKEKRERWGTCIGLRTIVDRAVLKRHLQGTEPWASEASS